MAEPTFDAPRRRAFFIPTWGGEGQIAALEFGDPSRPIDVVFLHANGFNAMTYRSVLAPMADRLRILAIDQQGHGCSPQRATTVGRRSWIGFSDDLVAVLDQLDGPPVVLAGHSMGGAVAVLAAPRRPKAVKALALFDPVILTEELARRALETGMAEFAESGLAAGAKRRRAVFASREEVYQSYSGRGAFKTWPDAALKDYITDGFRELDDGRVELTCAPGWESANFAHHAHDTHGALNSLRVPVTILRPEFGPTCSIGSADDFLADNPAMRVETIAGSTHFLPLERPELVQALLLEAVG